ncbi:serpin-zx [Phtheirospermum japonicum]|uniref:Serpin-zx n=1 Tax=Phtheirospermum japonicum TaxID=374723 RepID=A0A830B4R5_9LAMI|nr:serpin-zx [Phtheirospermum japonicum]
MVTSTDDGNGGLSAGNYSNPSSNRQDNNSWWAYLKWIPGAQPWASPPCPYPIAAWPGLQAQSQWTPSPFDQKYELAKALRNLRESIVKQTDVSLTLAKHVISTQAKDTNFVFSPLSMHVLLCMVAAGSGGPTRDQLLGYLKSSSVEELNSLSSQQSLKLKPAFKEIVENDYKAASNHVDFQNKAEEVRQEVNAWAEKETNGLIKDLLPSGSAKDHDFFLSNGTSVRVPFMTSQDKQCVSAFDDFKVLRLPYKQGDDNRMFSMYLYLPDARDGLPALVDKFGSIPGFIERHLPDGPVRLEDFRLPKFKIQFDFEASGTLRAGIGSPFLAARWSDGDGGRWRGSLDFAIRPQGDHRSGRTRHRGRSSFGLSHGAGLFEVRAKEVGFCG